MTAGWRGEDRQREEENSGRGLGVCGVLGGGMGVAGPVDFVAAQLGT